MQLTHSSSFKDYFTDMDEFAKITTFSHKRAQRFHTKVGVTLTYVIYAICVIMMIMMGTGFIFKKNPFSYLSELFLEKIPFVNATELGLFAAIGVSRASSFQNPNGTLIYSRIIYYQGNNIASIRSAQACKDMGNIDQNLISAYNLTNFLCFAIQDENYGGPTTNSLNSYATLEIRLCQLDFFKNCRTALVNAIENSPDNFLTVETYFPVVHYDPSNYESPVQIKMQSDTDLYRARNAINKELYFTNTTLLNDKGSVFESIEVETRFGVTYSSTSSYFKYSSSSTASLNALIYTVKISIGRNQRVYKRSYQKIQDVLALVGGFYKFLTTLGGFLFAKLIDHLQNLSYSNMIVNFDDESTTSNEKIKKLKDLLNTDNLKNSTIESDDDHHPWEVIYKNVQKLKKDEPILRKKVEDGLLEDPKPQAKEANNNDLSNNSRISPQFAHIQTKKFGLRLLSQNNIEELQNVKNIDNSGFPLTEKKKLEDFAEKLKIKNEKKILKENKKNDKFKLKFNARELIRKQAYCCCFKKYLTKNELSKWKIYSLANEYVKNKLDIKGYLDMSNEFRKMKEIILNVYQFYAFRHISHPVFPINRPLTEQDANNFEQVLDYYNKNYKSQLKEMGHYYINVMLKEELTNKDKLILTNLDNMALEALINRFDEIKSEYSYIKNGNNNQMLGALDSSNLMDKDDSSISKSYYNPHTEIKIVSDKKVKVYNKTENVSESILNDKNLINISPIKNNFKKKSKNENISDSNLNNENTLILNPMQDINIIQRLGMINYLRAFLKKRIKILSKSAKNMNLFNISF